MIDFIMRDATLKPKSNLGSISIPSGAQVEWAMCLCTCKYTFLKSNKDIFSPCCRYFFSTCERRRPHLLEICRHVRFALRSSILSTPSCFFSRKTAINRSRPQGGTNNENEFGSPWGLLLLIDKLLTNHTCSSCLDTKYSDILSFHIIGIWFSVHFHATVHLPSNLALNSLIYGSSCIFFDETGTDVFSPRIFWTVSRYMEHFLALQTTHGPVCSLFSSPSQAISHIAHIARAVVNL